MKSDKIPYIIYADRECLIKKIHESANNPEKLSPTTIRERIPCAYSMLKTSILCIAEKIV